MIPGVLVPRETKTLMPGGFIPPVQIIKTGFPRRWRRGRIDHAMAGQNLFQINVREKKGPVIKQ